MKIREGKIRYTTKVRKKVKKKMKKRKIEQEKYNIRKENSTQQKMGCCTKISTLADRCERLLKKNIYIIIIRAKILE